MAERTPSITSPSLSEGVDISPISTADRRNSLEKHLQTRPDEQDLKNRHILLDTNTAPALQARQQELERQRATDNLKKGLEKRPERGELVERNILPDSTAAPSLQGHQRDLEKHMRADSLDNKLQNRPKPDELVNKGILHCDPNFKRSFFAMAYTSDKGLYPECGVTQEDVIRDVQILAQLTNLVRIYGANCNLPDYMLNAIKLTKVDLKVYLGNYIQLANDESYQRQKVAIEDALKKHGTDNVAGVTVGNEVMLNYCLDQGTTDANDPIVKPASDYIIASIADTRSSLAAIGFGDVKVGNADAGSYFSTAVLEVSDFGLSNVHPWFAQQTVTASVQWTWDFFQEQNVQPASLLANKPEMFLAETGWPSGSAWENTTNSGAGVGGEASVANLQIFLDNFLCQSNTQGIKYFYFELFDQLWKDQQFGGVEGYWGLLDAERKLKPGLTIPSCTF